MPVDPDTRRRLDVLMRDFSAGTITAFIAVGVGEGSGGLRYYSGGHEDSRTVLELVGLLECVKVELLQDQLKGTTALEAGPVSTRNEGEP